MAPDAATRPAVLLVLSSIVSVQCGSALATTLFDTVGPGGAVLLRSAFAALALLALAGRSLRSIRRHEVRDVLYFGIALAAMNASFYAAIDRIPLGVAVTIQFIGPLSVAILGSRRRRDIGWGLLAAVGVVLLSEGAEGGSIDALGVALALAAGACWGLYIVLSARVGGPASGGSRSRSRSRPSSSSPTGSPPAAATSSRPGCSRSGSPPACSARRSPTSSSSRHCAASPTPSSG